MPKVTVSICIPTYNQVEYLKKCIQSILVQDYLDYEIVISDDSTNDTVKSYIDSLGLNEKISYYRNSPSLGTPENWNHSISKAQGKYIKVLHHDDFFTETNSLAQFVSLLENNPKSDFGFSATLVWNIKTNKKSIHTCTLNQLAKLKNEYHYLFFKNLIGAPSAIIYRKEMAVKFDNTFKWLVDIDFYISALTKNNSVQYIEKPLICTIHGMETQVTQQIEYDKQVQIKEHVLLFSKIVNHVKSQKNYFLFFDELFLRYDVNSMEDLKQICEVPENLNEFFNQVFQNLHKFKTLKRIKYRLLNSKYNRRYFKIEKY
ncbi:MAG: glycosyltransferase family 2 protein [Sphingobacteriaceae bacterium]|nr:glycosyltransferase family 2 protein [Sphingobacteriaceae bacterium]